MNSDSQTSSQAALRKALRKQIIQRRAEMPEKLRLEKSQIICENLESILDKLLSTKKDSRDFIVGVYSAFPEEVQLDAFIRYAYNKGVQVAFPCMVKDAWSVNPTCSQTMEMRTVNESYYSEDSVEFLLHPLKSYHHSDKEIALYPYIPGPGLSLLICPLVGFDKDNNRIGYGGGNYDRYLTQLSEKTQVLGVAFSEQQVENVPTEEHDIPLPILFA